MTRIGVGGLINLGKLKTAHAILNDIQLFHYHNAAAMPSDGDGPTSSGGGDWWDWLSLIMIE